MMFEICSALFNSFAILSLFKSNVRLIRQSQYFVSLADFKDITRNFSQSFRELPALPFTIFAPIDVALQIS